MVSGDYALGIAGIVLSVIFFVVGYRQTIGAKKERVNSANTEVERILVRRMFSETYVLRLADVSRIREGKARDFRVRATDLHTESQLLNSVYTRIVENDFIGDDQRSKILNRVTPVAEEAEAAPIEEQQILALTTTRRRLLYRTPLWLGAMGVTASLLGTVVAFLPNLPEVRSELTNILPAVVTTAVASLSVIVALVAFLRFRDSQDDDSAPAALEHALSFEREVINGLIKLGFVIHVPGSKRFGYDFALHHEDGEILIEVKAWRGPVPPSIVASTARQLSEAVEREGASEGIVVIQRPVGPVDKVGDRNKVKIMSLRELQEYLSQSSAI